MKNVKTLIAVVLALVLSLTCLAGCYQPQADAAVEIAPGGILCLRVNPEIAVAYDSDGKVTGVTARNDEALKILENYAGFEGKEVKTVVVELVDLIGKAGYFVEELDGEKRQITLEIEPGSSLPTGTFLNDVIANVKEIVNSNDWAVPLDVKGESAFGVTDYVDTDYGVNNDGVTDFGKTNYDATDYGKTNYDATDYGAAANQATEPAAAAKDDSAADSSTASGKSASSSGSSSGKTANGKTDYTDYNDPVTDYGKTDYNDKKTDYGKTNYTDYGSSAKQPTEPAASEPAAAEPAAAEPAAPAEPQPTEPPASQDSGAASDNAASGSANKTGGKTDYGKTDYGKTDYNDKATDYGKTDYNDPTDYGTVN